MGENLFTFWTELLFSLSGSLWNLKQAIVCLCICVLDSLHLCLFLFPLVKLFFPSSFHLSAVVCVFGAKGRGPEATHSMKAVFPSLAEQGKPRLCLTHTHTHTHTHLAAHKQVYTNTHTHTDSFMREVVSGSGVQRCEPSRCASPFRTDCCCFSQLELEKLPRFSVQQSDYSAFFFYHSGKCQQVNTVLMLSSFTHVNQADIGWFFLQGAAFLIFIP